MNQLNITLCPKWKDGSVENMMISMDYPGEGLVSCDELPALQFPDLAFGGLCPFPDTVDLKVEDEAGKVPFITKPCASISTQATFKGLYFERKPEGTVRWSYTVLPRVLPEGYRSSPYYDFRAEPLGLNGSAMFSFILPATDMATPMQVHLEWDLSRMPEGARGIWSFGEGPVDIVLTQYQLMLSLFNTGLMESVEKDGFGVYWFSQPDFDIKGIAEKVLPIYLCEKQYFGDDRSEFRVFLRRDPFEFSGGGSACPYAFITGYSAFGNNDADGLYRNMMHEMTHTWPSMVDLKVGEGTWFTEGATEYYCTKIPYEAGFLDAEFTAESLNNKIGFRYLDNPFREVPNDELPAIQWKERRAQTVPYGRGMYYLANLEAKLKSRGLGSIDEIVKKHNIMNPMTAGEWETFVREKLGDEGIQDFEDMKAGKLLPPQPDLFGPDIITVEKTVEINGKEMVSYYWKARK